MSFSLSRFRPLHRPAAALVLILGAACSSAVPARHGPEPAEIPELERVVARDTSNAEALVRLGVAYRAADRVAEARGVLERAMALRPAEPAGVLYLGLTYEDLDEPALARDLYVRYLDVGRSAALKRQLRSRLPVLEQQMLRLAVREAVAREAELGAAVSEPGTVAVFPFLYRGTDPDLQPLSRAMAELLVTDLSQTGRLRVLERARVQLLLDELKLAEQGWADPATAARGGRLLAAGRVVQGQIDGDEALLRMHGAVLSPDVQWDGRAVSESDALQRLFDLEKRFALGVFSALDIELTPAERERVLRQPTASLEALLAFGHCLAADDAGDHARAADDCERAVALDPGFGMAREHGARAREIAGTRAVSTRRLDQMGLVEFPDDRLLALDLLQDLLPHARDRGAALEASGREGFGQQGSIEIILQRP